jgi:hypothetical protein
MGSGNEGKKPYAFAIPALSPVIPAAPLVIPAPPLVIPAPPLVNPAAPLVNPAAPLVLPALSLVIPAKAGIQVPARTGWIPAPHFRGDEFTPAEAGAGMTDGGRE